MFDKRDQGIGIIFVGNVVPGERIRDTVRNRDSIVLHKNGENVLIRSVQSLGDLKFKGVIYGFEPSHELEYQGLRVDDEVEFEEQQIISCSDA